jgi:hypothetical protein
MKKSGKGKKAQAKPASEPAQGPIGNAPGVYIPKPDPNLGGGSTKIPPTPQTPAEKNFMEKLQDKLQDKIDAGVEKAGYSQPAMIAGSLATAVNKGLLPTQLYEIIPVGKLFKLGKKGVELAKGADKVADAAQDAAKIKKAADAAADAAKTKKAADAAAEAKKTADAAASAKKATGAKKAVDNGGGNIPGKKKKSPKEACKHKNDSKKKKYVVYKADQFDKDGNKIGTYVGRTSGEPNESTQKILDRRQSGHAAAAKKGIGMSGTRILGPLQSVFVTDSYSAVRGAEHLMKDQHSTVKQINPIGPKNQRKDDYVDCAKSKGLK